MGADNSTHGRIAAVATLCVVSVEQLAIFVMLRKMLADQLQELPSDVS